MAIDDSINGFGLFEHGGSNHPMSYINRDPSIYEDRVDSCWRLLFNRGWSDMAARIDDTIVRRHEQGGSFDSQSD